MVTNIDQQPQEIIYNTTQSYSVICEERNMSEDPKYPESSDLQNSAEEDSVEVEQQILQSFMDTPDLMAAYPSQLTSQGIVTDSARHPEYRSIEDRMDTFQDWIHRNEQTPRNLAEAGFLYSGIDDCTRCFFCGGGLRNWEPGNIPWVEHARWFPQCSYVKLCKGKEFIESCKSGKHCPQDAITEPVTFFSNPGPLSNDFHEKLDQAVDNSLKSVRPALVEKFSSQHIRAALTLIYIKQGHFQSIDHNKLHESLLNMTKEQIQENIAVYMNNNRLRQRMQCKVCSVQQVSIVLLPCGHLAVCSCCAFIPACPICGTECRARLRVHFA